MNLRPHHALCIQKFTGHGYSEAFTRHMTRLVTELKAHPESMITITCGCDTPCAVCPNNIDGVCTSLEKVAGMDAGVLEVCGLAYNESIPWGDLARLARERIFETENFYEICASCQWFDLCKGMEI